MELLITTNKISKRINFHIIGEILKVLILAISKLEKKERKVSAQVKYGKHKVLRKIFKLLSVGLSPSVHITRRATQPHSHTATRCLSSQDPLRLSSRCEH